MTATSEQRFLVLWFPDWPAQAVACADHHDNQTPRVVTGEGKNRAVVWVCSASARAMGIRRGMKLRYAQALCPNLEIAGYDQERDACMFEPILAGLDQIAAGVEVLRPGLAVVDAGAAARYHGSEHTAAQLLIDASASAGIDSCAGIAGELFTALIAARVGAVVPPGMGKGQAFLRPLSITLLSAEEALGCDPETVASFQQLGIRTLGELADLPYKKVVTRFGEAGQRCHDIAHAHPSRSIAPPLPTDDLRVMHEPDDPITRVDVAAFLARQLATALHARLARAGVVCHLLTVRATMANGDTVERTWRTRDALTEHATADRVRWQLDGWLTTRRTGGDWASTSSDDGVVRLELDPVECVAPQQDASGLWGARGEREAAVQRVVARVQSTLGTDAVLQPRHVGGRGPAERIDYVPFGEERPYPRDPDGAWPGRIPAPHPAQGYATAEPGGSYVALYDQHDRAIIVTQDVQLSAQPATLQWGQRRFDICGWAGPWGVDERWWTPHGKTYARLHVAGTETGDDAPQKRETAWLLVWSAGQWGIEGSYS